MISFEYSKETSYNYAPGNSPSPITTVMLTGADFLAGAPTNVHNGARASTRRTFTPYGHRRLFGTKRRVST